MEPNISLNIKKYRELAGLTQEQLAEKMGVSRKAVIDWESGSVPRDSKLDKLGEVLGVKFTPLGMVEENPIGNESKHFDSKETFYTELIEKNESYSLIPKAVLRDYKIVPDKILDIITKSNDGEREAIIARYKGEKEALIAKHELIIAGLEHKSARLEDEVKKLEAEKKNLERQVAAKGK